MKTHTNNIRTVFFLCSLFFALFSAVAQAPNKMSYQAVVRNTAGVLVANTNVGIQISILQTTATGTAVYIERHTTPTNANGLASIEIGGGTLQSGNFTTINWANGPYFIKTETDPTGGTTYSISGTSQMLSVPYALFAANSWGLNGNAATATSFIGTTNNADLVFKRNNVLSGTIGISTTAFGANTLEDNTTGTRNTAVGSGVLIRNTIGSSNTAVGFVTLLANITGNDNTGIGDFALRDNSIGSGNTANGKGSLAGNTTGNNNTAVGNVALLTVTTGSSNTGLGNSALSTVTTGNNNTAVGFNAQVAVPTNNNQVRIGNTAVALASVQVAWTITSDNRWKSNIKKSNLGLEFIKQLNPVFYTRKDIETNESKTTILETTTNQTIEYGFIAQELESTLNKFNVKDNGIITKDNAGMLSLRYNDLLAPIVKAMQEQQAMIEELQKEIKEIKSRK
ncbi:tail fiber domain-containing protein [Flavobacterium sp. XS2P14]|uniref:tail fiber domain-containing protein n=1 Tax=Flavobacterium sp. XS2P14 TaxID=3401735 RepID=UPI003AADC42A